MRAHEQLQHIVQLQDCSVAHRASGARSQDLGGRRAGKEGEGGKNDCSESASVKREGSVWVVALGPREFSPQEKEGRAGECSVAHLLGAPSAAVDGEGQLRRRAEHA
eukprot:5005896-Pleurochrysis_carterae.AAC.1